MINHNFIRGCTFALPCPKRWETLKDIGISSARYCNKCGRLVYLADDGLTLLELISNNKCIALSHDLYLSTTKEITRPKANRYLGCYVLGGNHE